MTSSVPGYLLAKHVWQWYAGTAFVIPCKDQIIKFEESEITDGYLNE